MKTKRQELGELLAHLRSDRAMSRHNIADKLRTTTPNVERIERGDLCPTREQWQSLRVVFPKLTGSTFRDLHAAAALEQLAEQEGKPPPPVAQLAPVPDLEAAATLVVEAIPNMRSCTIEIDDTGDMTISYRTRELRIVEDEGSVKITRTPKQGA